MTTDPAAKNLNSVERRALRDLVKNDYDILRSELRSLYEKAQLDAQAEHRATLAKTASGRHAKAQKVRTDLAKITQKATADIEKIVATAEREGYTLVIQGASDRYGNHNAFSGIVATLADVEDAKADRVLKDTLKDLQSQFTRANNVLDRQELTAQRDLLLTALTSDTAKDFLASIPSARDLFILAAIES